MPGVTLPGDHNSAILKVARRIEALERRLARPAAVGRPVGDSGFPITLTEDTYVYLIDAGDRAGDGPGAEKMITSVTNETLIGTATSAILQGAESLSTGLLLESPLGATAGIGLTAVSGVTQQSWNASVTDEDGTGTSAFFATMTATDAGYATIDLTSTGQGPTSLRLEPPDVTITAGGYFQAFGLYFYNGDTASSLGAPQEVTGIYGPWGAGYLPIYASYS